MAAQPLPALVTVMQCAVEASCCCSFVSRSRAARHQWHANPGRRGLAAAQRLHTINTHLIDVLAASRHEPLDTDGTPTLEGEA